MSLYFFEKVYDRLYDFSNDIYCNRFQPKNPRPDDLWIVEFPKSGITWMSFIIANTMSLMRNDKGNVNMFNFHDYVQSIHMGRSLGEPVLWPYYRVITSHSRVNRKYNKVLYLIRDPRNVMLSYYNMTIGLGWWKGSFGEFIRHKRLGIRSWFDHVHGWMCKSKHFNKMYYLKYEDLRANTKKSVTDIYDFLGLYVNDVVIEEAIERSSLSNMKKLEKKQEEMDLRKKTEKFNNGNYKFVGRGSIEGKKNDFSDSDYDYIVDVAEEYGKFFGYW